MIHENNLAPEGVGVADVKIAAFEARYDDIVQKAAKEYEDESYNLSEDSFESLLVEP